VVSILTMSDNTIARIAASASADLRARFNRAPMRLTMMAATPFFESEPLTPEAHDSGEST
jgi:hypothetical protein